MVGPAGPASRKNHPVILLKLNSARNKSLHLNNVNEKWQVDNDTPWKAVLEARFGMTFDETKYAVRKIGGEKHALTEQVRDVIKEFRNVRDPFIIQLVEYTKGEYPLRPSSAGTAAGGSGSSNSTPQPRKRALEGKVKFPKAAGKRVKREPSPANSRTSQRTTEMPRRDKVRHSERSPTRGGLTATPGGSGTSTPRTQQRQQNGPSPGRAPPAPVVTPQARANASASTSTGANNTTQQQQTSSGAQKKTITTSRPVPPMLSPQQGVAGGRAQNQARMPSSSTAPPVSPTRNIRPSTRVFEEDDMGPGGLPGTGTNGYNGEMLYDDDDTVSQVSQASQDSQDDLDELGIAREEFKTTFLRNAMDNFSNADVLKVREELRKLKNATRVPGKRNTWSKFLLMSPAATSLLRQLFDI